MMMERENEENIWRRGMFFVEEVKNEEGKGGKYKEKENVTNSRWTDAQETLEGCDEQFRDSSGDQRSLTLASRLF